MVRLHTAVVNTDNGFIKVFSPDPTWIILLKNHAQQAPYGGYLLYSSQTAPRGDFI